jgi:hypothetical protein
MKSLLRLASFLCLVLPISTVAQENKSVYLTFHAGGGWYEADITDTERIRDDVPEFLVTDNEKGNLRSRFSSTNYSAQIEFALKRRITLSSGVKYSEMVGTLEKQVFSNGYFFYLLREEGTTTELVSLERIEQTGRFIGVPVQARWYPLLARRFNLYVAGAAEFDFRLSTEHDIDFHQPRMETVQYEMEKQLKKPDRFVSIFHIGTGFVVGREGKPRFGLEAWLPSVVLTRGSTGIVDAKTGGGMNVSVQIPLKKSIDE